MIWPWEHREKQEEVVEQQTAGMQSATLFEIKIEELERQALEAATMERERFLPILWIRHIVWFRKKGDRK